jgi:hypothetical protein
MGTTIQTRLDEKMTAEMNALLARTGWSTSKAVREALRKLIREKAEETPPVRIHGLGEFDFGVTDLSTNKKYMEDYGRSSLPAAKARRKAVKR